MRSWLSGKRGGLLVFLGIAALVVGGLGWATLTALELEEERIITAHTMAKERAEAAQRLEAERARTALANNLRLALWRLDSRMFTELAREASRPYHHFDAGIACRVAPPGKLAQEKPITVIELLPIPDAAAPEWMQRHFLIALESDWQSPQALREAIVKGLDLAGSKQVPAKDPAAQEKLLAELASNFSAPALWSYLRQQDLNYADPPGIPAQEFQPGQAYGNDVAGRQQETQKIDKDTYLRQNRGRVEKGQGALQNSVLENFKQGSPNQVIAFPGPIVPLWLTKGDARRLALARSIQLADRRVSQVTLVDQPQLQAILAEEVQDLFPEARLTPVLDSEPEHPERAMTALPFELDPGPAPVLAALAIPPGPDLPTGWTPLRVGLALAWAAALVALLAVGLGGWSLLDLSERRIRFVSAVTHELRTPLTTLRLYLDMLTSGMVKDEARRKEYLETLNSESERLHRLVGNVLDFSRLENGQPRLEQKPIALGDLVEQVQSNWVARCHSAGKELAIESTVENGATLTTDAQLVQQILGNLIDNACKYSREATDPRIELRLARENGTVIFEVADRGPGIASVERRSIFRPFRRGRSADVTAGGVGLGLALAQRWARLLGGDLRLVPAAQGARFRLELPLK